MKLFRAFAPLPVVPLYGYKNMACWPCDLTVGRHSLLLFQLLNSKTHLAPSFVNKKPVDHSLTPRCISVAPSLMPTLPSIKSGSFCEGFPASHFLTIGPYS